MWGSPPMPQATLELLKELWNGVRGTMTKCVNRDLETDKLNI